MRQTTRCCSALVAFLAALPLVTVGIGPVAAAVAGPLPAAIPFLKHSKPSVPLSLFPVRTAWTLALNNALTAPPAYDERRGYYPIDGDRVVAYDLVTGTRLWIASAHTTVAPAAGDDLVFLVVADAIEARRAADGSVAWRLPFGDQLAVPLEWDTGWLVAATSTGSILALRAVDGALLWRHDLGTAASARPALGADRVYVPLSDGRVVALALENGTVLWEHKLGGGATDVLPLEDRLFVGSKDNFFYCLRTRDGGREWRWRTGADIIGRPAVDENNVYFVSLDNVLRALHRTSGVQQWKRVLPLRPTSGVIKAGDTLIVSGFATSLPGFSAKDGTPAGTITIDTEPAAPPHLLRVPGAPTPSILLCTQDLATGATVKSVTREIDPANSPVAPLPNPIKPGAEVTPAKPSAPGPPTKPSSPRPPAPPAR